MLDVHWRKEALPTDEAGAMAHVGRLAGPHLQTLDLEPEALSADPRFQTTLINAITTEELMKHDVLFVGSYRVEQPGQIKAIKTFVACGGGLILNHAACGRGSPQTLFPDIAAKVLDRRPDTILVVKDPQHPLAAGLPPQALFGRTR